MHDTLTRWRWALAGRPLPPPHVVKQHLVRRYARRYGTQVLVETGTLYGDMVDAMKSSFEQIYSIEIDAALAARAQRRFADAPQITILHDDSSRALPALLPMLERRALFWLDGHFSGGETGRGEKDTPVLEELETILGDPRHSHVILIDDARLFGASADYPSLERLEQRALELRPNITMTVRDDCIRLTPKRARRPRERAANQ